MRRRPPETFPAICIAALALAAVIAAGFAHAAAAADSAVVFLYHRFGESQYPATSIRLDEFDAEIAELKSGGYHVMPVPEILAALKDGRPLPDFAVGLTVDDGYESVATEAWPRLKAAGFPLTVFVATDPIDRGFHGYMTWDQIRALVRDGVTIGAHTASHLHMADASAGKIADDIARSNARFKAELGFVPEIFAYPYGETSLAVQAQVKDSGYRFAFGQHSGVISRDSDFLDLPRFALNEHYGSADTFRVRARALPLPVRDFTPADPLITSDNPPAIGFTVGAGVTGLEKLACYGSQREGLAVKRLGANRFEVRLAAPLAPGRFRLNCTLPEGEGRFRWFGAAFYVPGR